MDETMRIHEEVVDLFNRYADRETGDLINALVFYVDSKCFKARTDGAMYAVDRIKASFGGDNG